MSVIDDLKTALAPLDSAMPIRIQLGDGGPIFQPNVADFMTALGVKPTPRRTVKVNATHLNVRAQASASAPIVAKLDLGALVTVFDSAPVQSDGHTWLKTVDGHGWIAVDLTVAPDAPLTVTPPATVTTPSTPPASTLPPSTTPPSTSPRPKPISADQRGLGLSAGGWAPSAAHCDTVRRSAISFALICAYEPNQAAATIAPLYQAGIRTFILRACTHEKPTTTQRFTDLTLPILRDYATAIARLGANVPTLIAIGNEPNLVNEGCGSAWHDGASFAAWWQAVAATYRTALPGALLGFPALSPGGDVPGVRIAESAFLAGCGAALQAADWVGVHYYWQLPNGADIGPPLAQWRAAFGSDRLIVGTEVGPADATRITPDAVRLAYQRFAAVGIPACAWLLSGAGAWGNAAWDANNIVLD